MSLTRREFAESLLAAGGASALSGCFSTGIGSSDYDENLRDRCWLRGHDVGFLDAPGNRWNIPVEGKADMVSACLKMGLDNLDVIRWGNPPPEYRRPFASLKRVTWPICGPMTERGASIDDLCEYDFALLDEMPNLIGFEMDDFFRRHLPTIDVQTPSGSRPSLQAAFPYDRLVSLRRRLDNSPRELGLRLSVSDELLEDENLIVPCADQATTVTFWIREGKNLRDFERLFRKYRTLLPFKPTFLGVQLWDFGGCKPMDMDALKFQLEYGLELWHRREITGFVFSSSALCNKSLPTVEYVRQWIAVHGDERRLLEPEHYHVGNISSRLVSGEENRRFRKAFEFLHRTDLAKLPVGRYAIDGDNVYAMVQTCDLKPTSEARAEAHRRYIDIQTPLTGSETYGVARLSYENFRKVFDSLADVQFCDQGLDFFTLQPGKFAMFLPPRGLHAPGLTLDEPHQIRKLVIKVMYRT